MTTKLKELTEKLAEKSKLVSQIFEEAGEDRDFSKVKCLGEGDTQAKLEKLRQLDAEVTDIKAEREGVIAVEAIHDRAHNLYRELNEPAKTMTHPEKDAGGHYQPIKSLGDLFVECKAHQDKHVSKRVDVDLKTLFETAAGWDPEATRISRVELYPLRALSVIDYIPQLTTDKDTIKYMKETTFTNNAAEAAAGATYGEAALVYTETSDEVEKIGVWLPVTDEQLEDVASFPGFLNTRLEYMLKNRLDSQVLNGNGSTPNLLGTVNLGSVQTQAKGTDATPDAFFKAITLVRHTGFSEPSVIFINPNDWQAIRLLTTADGIYIFGSPMDTGPERMWGVPCCITTAVTENTGIVGDYRGYSNLYFRRGIEFLTTNAHSDYFIKGKQAIRADLRCSMVHYRDTAFCTVTGI